MGSGVVGYFFPLGMPEVMGRGACPAPRTKRRHSSSQKICQARHGSELV